jgi:hypothetical protein
MMPRDRWGLRRSFRTPPGRSAVSWRWEIGLPLLVVGGITALISASADMGGALFWGGAAVAAVGASLFFSGLISR